MVLNIPLNIGVKCGVKVKFTKQEVQEFLKCKEDPIYFIENYCKIVSFICETRSDSKIFIPNDAVAFSLLPILSFYIY
mgnify:CR=1 FL=1